ncbi:MAG TPA: hypothetical protein VHB77_10635, partial [Planctomycetaceae bacterium]|nr:hypothetical protein [Planctomycetaceae bacterium]
PPQPGPKYYSRPKAVDNLGDIAVMLKLPVEQQLFRKQRVSIHQVSDTEGFLWQPAADADVLLLGDSFTNIFSLAEMHWGEAAGLAEHLSLAWQRPIDRIAQNDAGAYATRQTLALELGRGHDRLAGKRVVIWEFAARELAVGDWKVIPMPRPRHNRAPVVPPPSSEEMQVEGRVVAAAAVPPPGSVPYRDAVTAVHVVEVAGIPNKEAVVYLWGMKDNRLTAAAHLEREARVRLKLTPWTQVEKRYGRYTRVELDDPDFTLIELPTFWGELVP